MLPFVPVKVIRPENEKKLGSPFTKARAPDSEQAFVEGSTLSEPVYLNEAVGESVKRYLSLALIGLATGRHPTPAKKAATPAVRN